MSDRLGERLLKRDDPLCTEASLELERLYRRVGDQSKQINRLLDQLETISRAVTQ